LESNVEELRERTSGVRFLELDGLRGLAAFTVVWHHFWLMYGLHERWWLLPLISGKQAVNLFFLLSGFVLSLPFWKPGYRLRYGSYLIRRFFRIYVPYAGVVLICAALSWRLGRNPMQLSPFFDYSWQSPVTMWLVVRHLLGAPTYDLNNAFWTLRVEMQMSILFPLLIFVLRRIPAKASLTLAFVVMIAAARLMIYGMGQLGPAVELVQYACIFALGAALAQHRERIHQAWQKAPQVVRWLFLIASLLCYWGYADMLLLMIRPRGVPLLLQVIGGCGLLVSALNLSSVHRALRSRSTEYLGRVSYSMYLLHEPALYALTILLFARVSVPMIAMVYLMVVMIAAHLYCAGVEQPSLRTGKKISMKFAGGRG
jgi:peptidoglycan/LPS O-acetylase OafA/YrhL